MNTQSGKNNPDDTRPDGATVELDTQPYARKGDQVDAGQQLTDKAGQVAEQAKDALGETVSKVREQAVSQVDAQKARATETVNSVAQAVHQTAEQLRQQDQGAIAGYADKAADQIERFSTYLNNRDFNDLAIEVQRFARRQPAIFLGGALLAGMLAARFLKSSAPQPQGGQYPYNYGGYGQYGGYSSYGSYNSYPGGRNYRDSGGNGPDYADSGYDQGSGVSARVPASGFTSSSSEDINNTSGGNAGVKRRGSQRTSSGGNTADSSSSYADSGDNPGLEVS
jgi:hypothetical protein